MFKKGAVVLALALIIALLAVATFSRPDGKVHIFVLGGSKYLSLLVQSQDGRRLIVGPSSDAEFLERVSKHIPFYEKKIDMVILTSGSQKDLDGLRKHFQLSQVLVSRESSDEGQVGLVGWQEQSWEGIDVRTFAVPGHSPMVELQYGSRNVLFVQKDEQAIGEAFPDKSAVDVQVGPYYTRGAWEGDSLARMFDSNVIYVNKMVQNVSDNIRVVDDAEIVW